MVNVRSASHAQSGSWTPNEDTVIKLMVSQNYSTEAIAQTLERGRDKVIRRIIDLGLYTPKTQTEARLSYSLPTNSPGREPLPAGHPYTWGLLTQGTSAEGLPYPMDLVRS